jgi:sulfatase modifying factor 1
LALASACGEESGAASSASAAAVTSAVSSALPSASAVISSGSASASAAVTPPPPMQPLPKEELVAEDLKTQREAMFERLAAVSKLSEAELAKVRAIIEKSKIISQGNPEISRYAMTRSECRSRRDAAGLFDAPEPSCGAYGMVPIWNTKTQTKEQATVCVDRYEFPNIACDYPLTWASAREAAQLCEAVGKRICDAHEWEGACAGSLLPPEEEYAFGKPRKEMKSRHNSSRERIWSYGSERKLELCATNSNKSPTCKPSGFRKCGSNTYPAGAFPQCKSSFGVYDLHGNAAEHMNFPMKLEQLASRGGSGETEMKGSWFIFQKYDAHEDDCRFRAPDWHATKLMSHDSHQNYHLGFRCCKNISATQTQ